MTVSPPKLQKEHAVLVNEKLRVEIDQIRIHNRHSQERWLLEFKPKLVGVWITAVSVALYTLVRELNKLWT